MRSAVILSGGSGTRMGGREKGLLRINGVSFIERKIEILSGFFSEILVVTNTPEIYSPMDLPARIIRDKITYGGALAALYTGIEASVSDFVFVTTSDTPFLKIELAEYLYREAGNADGMTAVWRGKIEPLCAVYRKTCLPYMQRALPEKRIRSFYPWVEITKAPEQAIMEIDPQGSSFININTDEDYRKVIQQMQQDLH